MLTFSRIDDDIEKGPGADHRKAASRSLNIVGAWEMRDLRKIRHHQQELYSYQVALMREARDGQQIQLRRR